MEWLENYLKGYSGAVLVVSHDRYFLDNICTRIWEVSFQTMTTYKGNFSAYLPQKEAADALRQKQHDADVALAEKLQDYVDRNLVRASTTKMAQSRRKQLEKLEITEAPKDETNQLKFRFEYDVEPWNELVLMKNLTIRIGERTLLEPFTYTVCRGQRLIIAGPNGAGKTTTLKSVVGIQQFDSGRITIGGHSIQDDPIACKKMLAYIPDNPDLYEFMTGIQYLNFIADIFGVEESARQERIRKYADLFELTTDLAQPVAAYSHGMKQKLAIIAALLHEPKLILMDEPFVGLDPLASHQLKTQMKAFCAQGGAIFFSTHVLEVAEKLCDRVAILRKGQLVRKGAMEQVRGDDTLEEVFLELEDTGEAL